MFIIKTNSTTKLSIHNSLMLLRGIFSLQRTATNIKTNQLCRTKYKKKEFSGNSLTHNNVHHFCKGKMYILEYENLHRQVNEKKEQLSHLEQKVNLLSNMSALTTYDRISRFVLSYMDKQHQTKAYKQHKDILITLRNQLQRKIDESSQKWQGPRKQILEGRQAKVNQFIQSLIGFELQMSKFIQVRLSHSGQTPSDIDQGLQLTYKLLCKILKKEGVVCLQPQAGSQFSLEEHQVAPPSAANAGKISKVLQKGWKVKQKIIRKAIVQLKQ